MKGAEHTCNVWPNISNSTYDQNATTDIAHVVTYLELLNVRGAVVSPEVAFLYCETQMY